MLAPGFDFTGSAPSVAVLARVCNRPVLVSHRGWPEGGLQPFSGSFGAFSIRSLGEISPQ
jgi:hypothetical protein